MAAGEGLKFVENREPQGCFGADTEALTDIGQDDIHGALRAMGLYSPEDGVQIVPASMLTKSMQNGAIPVSFGEALPFMTDEAAFDDSPDAAKERLLTLSGLVEDDDNSGIILLYPCQRPANPQIFAHFVAVAEPQERDAVLAVMDPSELRHPQTRERIGGVFQKTEEEMLAMLTPNNEMMVPVLAYTVRVEHIPEAPLEAEAGAVAGAEADATAELPRVGALV